MFKNVGANWALNALQILVLLKLAPFVVDALGRDPNGLWVTIVSLTGILSLLVLGVPMASVRYVAEHVSTKDFARANAAVSTCLAICIALGVAALAIGAALWAFFESTYLHGAAAASVTPQTIEGARIAFAIVAIQVAMGFAMRLPYGIFDAHHDFVVRNAIMAGELLLRLGLTLTLLAWKASLPVLACVQVACMLFEFTVALAVLRRRYPAIRFGLASFDRAPDALVIGARLDAAQVTFFDIGNKFFDPLTGLLIAVGAVVMPMTTRLQATGEREELRRLFLKWSKICLSLVLLVGVYLIVLGPEFLGWWIGPDFVGPSGRVLQVLMASFFFYLPVRGVALPVLLGLGKPKVPALALLAMGVVNLLLSLALVGPLGIVGVALGTAVPNVLFAGALLVLACRELGVPLTQYAGYVAGRAVVGVLLPLAVLLFLKHGVHVSGFASLVGAGLASVLAFAVAWFGFVYRGDPYLAWKGRGP